MIKSQLVDGVEERDGQIRKLRHNAMLLQGMRKVGQELATAGIQGRNTTQIYFRTGRRRTSAVFVNWGGIQQQGNLLRETRELFRNT
jgi:hypothetical protein